MSATGGSLLRTVVGVEGAAAQSSRLCCCGSGGDVVIAAQRPASSIWLTVLRLAPVWLASASMMLTLGAAKCGWQRETVLDGDVEVDVGNRRLPPEDGCWRRRCCCSVLTFVLLRQRR